MSDFKDEILLNKIRLNTDDDIRYLDKGDTPYAVNIDITDLNEGGLIVNKKGNKLVPFTFSIEGDNYKVIGSVFDQKRDQIIYFVHSDNVIPNNQSVNYILTYKDGVIGEVIPGIQPWELDVLDFKYDFKNIISAVVVDDLLIWTDNNSEPKCLNLVSNFNRFFSTHTRADIFFNLMKACPSGKISARFIPRFSSSDYKISSFDDSLYQFAMKYEYYDNMISEFGNYSNWVRCFDSTRQGVFYLNFTLPIGFISYGIKKMKFYYRKNFGANWHLFETIEFDYNDYDVIYIIGSLYEDTGIVPTLLQSISDGGEYMVLFNNSKDVLEVIEDNLLFSAVPNKTKSLAFCDNRLLLANNEIGLADPLSQAITLSPIMESKTAIPSFRTGVTAVVGVPTNLINIQAVASFPVEGFQYPSFVAIEAQFSLAGTNLKYDNLYISNATVFVKKGITSAEYQELIYSSIKIGGAKAGSDNVDIYRLNSSGFVSIDVTNACTSCTQVSQVNFYTKGNSSGLGLARGAKYQITYQFFDRYGRTTGPVKNESNIIDTGNLWTGLTGGSPAVLGFNWELPNNFVFPSWAFYMSFGISKNLTFKNTWVDSSVAVPASLAVKSPLGYTYEIGDTVRLFNDTVSREFNTTGFEEVISGETETGWIILEKEAATQLGNITGFEVYRRKVTIEEDYYEVTPRYDIINGDYIIGEEALVNNKGYHIGGDVILRNTLLEDLSLINTLYKNIINSAVGPLEYYSYKGITITSLGKYIPRIENFSPKRYQNIYYSDKFFDNTKINGLNRITFSSYYTFQDDYGEIAGLVNRGNVLTTVQRDKVTITFVGKTEFFDSSGVNNVVGKSSNVLGSSNVSDQNYGTIFMSSIVRGENFVYFYDSLKKAFVAVDERGFCAPVSNVKMSNYFNNLTLSTPLEDLNILSGYDHKNKSIYFTIDDKNLDNLQSLVWYEPESKWIEFIDHLDELGNSPENYCTLNNTFISFLKGELYVHNIDEDDNRCNFYNHVKNFVIDVVSNEAANRLKKYDTIAIHSSEAFDVYPEIEANISNSYGKMETEITKEEFKLRENYYKADYRRNTNTVGPELFIYKKFNGEIMRGYAIKNRLIAEQADRKITIFKVDVNQTFSK